jgi:hypothetical protein
MRYMRYHLGGVYGRVCLVVLTPCIVDYYTDGGFNIVCLR